MILANRLAPLLLLASLAGCDQVSALLELPDPAKELALADAEGRATGGACRHSGRSLEDCYLLNPQVPKAAVFAGWREMNDYMMQHEMQTVPSRLRQPLETGTPASPGVGSPPGAAAAGAAEGALSERSTSGRARSPS